MNNPQRSNDAPEKPPITRRHFTKQGTHPFDEIEWETRTALIGDPDNPTFIQHDVEVPVFWSQNATNIVAQKYFAYALNDPRRESSVRQMIERVAGRLAAEGLRHGQLASDEEKEIFKEELSHILVHQMASFNSPVWFNIGVEGQPQQASACFILSVEDSLRSITNWYAEEALVFQGGSGSGINVSKLRAAGEPLSGGGSSSGPVTFMRAADASAGTIASGGRTRRSAKMVTMDIDHPDVEDFIWCKAREEDRLHALDRAGFDLSIDTSAGERNRAEATSYQNANNSVRVTDEFMRAVEEDEEWELRARRSGEVTRRVRARSLMEEIAKAAHHSADPGIQYETTINRWHTTPENGKITTSNPCSEYVSNDNTSCNLSSVNLLKFLRDDESGESRFDVEGYEHTCRVMFLAQEITISFGDFPTQKITKNSRALRQIGLGYSNLGATLMSLGLPYDSPAGRAFCAAMTSVLGGVGYQQSGRLAARVGPFEHYERNREPMTSVLKMHQVAARKLRVPNDPLLEASAGAERELKALNKAARAAWADALELNEQWGMRNAQSTLLAPTGTISFMMDCDTTGIEPDFSLLKFKRLVGGGAMTIVNRAVPRALKKLGYSPSQIEEIIAYLEEEVDSHPRNTLVGAPHLSSEHLKVFQCAVGENALPPGAHLEMMAAAQPYLSGAISKTVNVPENATMEDISEIYHRGWELGLKALAIYRDGSKNAQPLSSKEGKRSAEAEEAAEKRLTSLLGDGLLRGERREIPREPQMVGVNFQVGTTGGYISVRLFDDGTPGAVFIDVGQAGSTLHGFIRAWAVTMSLGLQYGVPLDHLVSKLAWTQFEPAGITDDSRIRIARSIVDYTVRWLAAKFLDESAHEALGIAPGEGGEVGVESEEPAGVIPGGEMGEAVEVHAATVPAQRVQPTTRTGTFCNDCGGEMQRTGACMTCMVCGNNTGCG